MHNDRMHRHLAGHCAPAHRHVQQAALLEPVVRNIVVADLTERPARQERIAVLAVAGGGIGAVGNFVALRRQMIGLRQARPTEQRVREMASLGTVEQAHLLQKDEVGIERLDAEPEVVDLEPFARADAAHTFVDVVGGHAQDAAVAHRAVNVKRRRCRGAVTHQLALTRW